MPFCYDPGCDSSPESFVSDVVSSNQQGSAEFKPTLPCSREQLRRHPVSSEISDFTPCTHAQSTILHIKYAEKTDD